MVWMLRFFIAGQLHIQPTGRMQSNLTVRRASLVFGRSKASRKITRSASADVPSRVMVQSARCAELNRQRSARAGERRQYGLHRQCIQRIFSKLGPRAIIYIASGTTHMRAAIQIFFASAQLVLRRTKMLAALCAPTPRQRKREARMIAHV